VSVTMHCKVGGALSKALIALRVMAIKGSTCKAAIKCPGAGRLMRLALLNWSQLLGWGSRA